jgi:hypothetical protein
MASMTTQFRTLPWLGATLAGGLLLSANVAHAGAVYRCPGAVLTYTDQITPQQAKERGCKAIEGAPVSVVTASSGGVGVPTAPIASPRSSDTKVDQREQRERDRDARRILEEELRREQAKLAEMKKEFNNGEPERQGGERNYQRYQERVEQMRAAIARKEADLAAIQREFDKVSGAASTSSRGGS